MKTSLVKSFAFVSMLTFAQAVSALPPDLEIGLVHHYAFDETAGAVAFDSTGTNHASLGGYQAGDPRFVPGRIGNALQFSRTSNYAITNAPINFNQYTITFWSQLHDRTGINPRIAGPIESGWIAAEFFNNIGIGIFGVRDLNEPTIGVWEHYAITYDRLTGAASTYRDGEIVRIGTTNLAAPINPWVFGHNGGVTNNQDTWNGLLDDMRFYNRILGPGEIRRLAAVPEPASVILIAPGAVCLWLRWRRSRCTG